MSSRALLRISLIAVLAALALVLPSDPATNNEDDRGSELGPNQNSQNAVELAGNPQKSDPADAVNVRIELRPDEAVLLATSQSIGIPSFTGRVFLPAGGPAANAEVSAFGLEGWAMWMDAETEQSPDTVRFNTTCDETGFFKLPESSRDGMRFIIRIKHGELPPLQLVNMPAVPGRTRHLGELHLSNGFKLSGLVLGPGGEAVPNAVVYPVLEPDTATFSTRRRHDLPRLPNYQATTNAAGEFTFTHLPPGKLHLQAEAFSYAPGYSEGVRADEDENVHGVQISLEASQQISGQVVSPGNSPVVGARLRLDLDSDHRLYTESDADGAFYFDAPSGLAQPSLRTYAVGFNPQKTKITETSTPLLIQLTALPPLNGVVLDQNGKSITDANVRLVELRGRRRQSSNPRKADSSGDTTTTEDGGFSLTPDLRRTWGRRFRLAAWTDQHLPSWSDSFEFKEEENHLLPPFTLTLEPGTQVSGSVAKADGRLAIGARVHLRSMYSNRRANSRGAIAPDSMRPGAIHSTATVGANGQFFFTAIPTGDYRLEAHFASESPAYGKEFALLSEAYEEHLQLSRSSKIWGTVIGDLSLFKRLRVTASLEGHDDLHTTIDGKGEYQFVDLAEGTWNLIVREVDDAISASSFGMGNGEGLGRADGIEINAGDSLQVDIKLDFSGRAVLSGTVTVNGELATDINLFLMPRDLGSTGDPRLSWRRISRSIKSAATDFKGEYRFIGVDPEDYWLVIDHGNSWPEGLMNFGDPGEVSTGPTGLQRHNISLRADQELGFDISLQLGSIKGQAYRINNNGDNKAVRGGRIVATPISVGDGISIKSFDIGRKGSFTASNLSAGEWSLSISSGQYKSSPTPVTVYASSISEVEIECQKKKSKPKDSNKK